MKRHNPFQNIEPTFFSGLLDDPLLIIRVIPLGRNILVDCGQMSHLATRLIKSVDAVFITHAHMDHFIGFDQFTRVNLVTSRTIDIFGPPGIAHKIEMKLKGYDWNLAEDFFCSYRIHEVHPDCMEIYSIRGAERFKCSFEERTVINDRVIYESRYISVEADLCNHKIPVLIFAFTEKPDFSIDVNKIKELGLNRGPWLKELKGWFYDSMEEGRGISISVPLSCGTENREYRDEHISVLYETIKKKQECRRIGYITDIGLTEKNVERVISLMKDVTLLVCECTFLSEHQCRAGESFHLSTSDLNYLIKKIQPQYVLPMHLSKTYLDRTDQLYKELEVPAGCTLIPVPERLTPRPKLAHEMPDVFAEE